MKMNREDKIIAFIRRNTAGSATTTNFEENQTSNNSSQAGIHSTMQTNQQVQFPQQFAQQSQQFIQLQPLSNPNANLPQVLHSQRSIAGMQQNFTPSYHRPQTMPLPQTVIMSPQNPPNYHPQLQHSYHSQEVGYYPQLPQLQPVTDPHQLQPQYYPHELYHPQYVTTPQNQGYYPEGYPAEAYPMVVHAVGAHQDNNVAQGYPHAYTVSVTSGGHIAQNQQAGNLRVVTIRGGTAGDAQGGYVTAIRPASEDGNGATTYTQDESLRVNPDLRRTVSSGVANLAIYEQGFWNRQNQPPATSDSNNNNTNSNNGADKNAPNKKLEAPLQLDNVYGELRDYVDNTTCAICTDLFEDPRILPCGHTFCFNCIEALITAQRNEENSPSAFAQRRQVVTCPVCRSDFYQPNDASKLTKNFAVKSLVETVRVSAKNKATEKEAKKLAHELATQCLQTKTRLKDLQKHAVAIGRKFKVPLRITGVAQIGKKIYVITEGSNKLLVFDKNTKKPDSEVVMQGISQPKDIAGSDKFEFVFVVDSASNSICRVFVSGQKKGDVNLFVPGIYEPFNIFLSTVTEMVTKLDRKERLLCTYKADPVLLKCVKKIKLPQPLKHCFHAVQTPQGEFFVSHGLVGKEGGCGISKIDSEGNILTSLGVEFSFAGPIFCMVLTANGDIIASEGSLKSLLKFDPQLKTAKLIWKLKEELAPWKLNYQGGVLAVAYESECIQTFEI